MQLSVGVVIYDGISVLGCLPYGYTFESSNYLDLPKGRQDSGETHVQTAIRELYEETGLQVEEHELKYEGLFKYISSKNLSIFSICMSFNTETLKCLSQFTNTMGQSVYEMLGYERVKYESIDSKFFKSLCPIIKEVIRRANENNERY